MTCECPGGIEGLCVPCAKKIRAALNKYEQKNKNLISITPDFSIPEEWALPELDRGFTVEMLEREANKFIRYFSTRGNKRTMEGWKKTWVTWLNRSVG